VFHILSSVRDYFFKLFKKMGNRGRLCCFMLMVVVRSVGTRSTGRIGI